MGLNPNRLKSQTEFRISHLFSPQVGFDQNHLGPQTASSMSASMPQQMGLNQDDLGPTTSSSTPHPMKMKTLSQFPLKPLRGLILKYDLLNY
jgi:hypothetical protein